MYPALTGPLPKSSYLRLLEYQRQRMVLPAYAADLPLLLFIFFSRIAAGLSILSVFFPHSVLWLGTAFCCMVLATVASITHLTVPARFITMMINHRSPLVWEIRLAGVLTASLGAQVLSDIGFLSGGFLSGFGVVLPWTSFSLGILFIISTGWAYRFHTHPAWKTNILFGYYLASASMTGFALYSITFSNLFFRLITVSLLCAEGFLILLYLNHLCKTSWISLKRIETGKDRRVSVAFLASVLLLPGLITFAPLFTNHLQLFAAVLALSSGAGIVFERILFFRLEQPVFFLSRGQNSEAITMKSATVEGHAGFTTKLSVEIP
jgi:DMSO reductase anchor subunit